MSAAVVLAAGRYAGAFLLALPGPVAGVTGAWMKGKKSFFTCYTLLCKTLEHNNRETFLHHQ